MSRRAAVRREQRARRKIVNDKSPQGRERRIRLKGQNDGKTIAYYAILYLLLTEYDFNCRQIEKLCKLVGEESVKISKHGEQFVIMHYGKKIAAMINETGYQSVFLKEEETWYQPEFDDYYITTCAIMVIVLKDSFGFGTNKAGSGRLDKVRSFCAEEYMKIQKEPTIRTPEWYQARVSQVIENKGWEQKL